MFICLWFDSFSIFDTYTLAFDFKGLSFFTHDKRIDGFNLKEHNEQAPPRHIHAHVLVFIEDIAHVFVNVIYTHALCPFEILKSW